MQQGRDSSSLTISMVYKAPTSSAGRELHPIRLDNGHKADPLNHSAIIWNDPLNQPRRNYCIYAHPRPRVSYTIQPGREAQVSVAHAL